MKITEKLFITNEDNMLLMSRYPDKYFDLAIIDPPYGIKESGAKNKTRSKKTLSKDYKPFHGMDVEPPNSCFFKELFRTSKNQIVFGANHFISKIALDSSCWLVWDKDNGNTDFADSELAWTSFRTSVRNFKFKWQGMLQQDMKNKEFRIHPTQKPVALYKWILEIYANQGDKVLDTHLGSGSIAIACHDYGLELTACELDTHYYNNAILRIKNHTNQHKLF